MVKPTQRWVFLLSVCLLLQLFAPACTSHIHHKSVTYKKQKTKEESSGQKRGAIWSGIKLLAGRALTGITHSANALTFTGTMLQAIYGCNITEPEIPRLFEQVNNLKAEYDQIRKEIQDVSWQARETQIYANESFDYYKTTRDILRELNDEQVKVLTIMGTDVRLILDQFDHNMTAFFEKANATDELVDVTEVDTKFSSDLDTGLRLTFSGLSLAVPAMKKLWKTYIKPSVVGKKIQQLKDRFKTTFKPATEATSKAIKKVLSKGYMGRAQNFVLQKIQRIVTFAGPKFSGASKIFSAVKTGVKGALKLGGAALAVWTAYETFTKCKENLSNARKSLSDMQEAVKQIKEQREEMNKAYDLVKDAWTEVWETTTNELLIEVLTDVKAMMTDLYYDTAEDEKQRIATFIDNYIGLTNLDPEEKETQKALNDAQRDLNQNMNGVRVTLSCYRHKVNMFEAVKRKCAAGDDSFKWLYQDSKDTLPIDPDKDCQYRTGSCYITEERMRQGWEDWTSKNDSADAICLMNDETIVEDVKNELRDKVTDPQQIAEAVLRRSRVEAGVSEIEQMIAKIQEQNPNIENELPSELVSIICRWKRRGRYTCQRIVEKLEEDYLEEGQVVTVKMVEDLKCD